MVRRLVATGHRVVAADADPRAAGAARADVAVVHPRAEDPRFGDALVAAATAHGVDALVPTVAEELAVLRPVAFWLSAAGIASWLPD
ncbi:hypothetical protein, partial [Curtobacterium sp. P97]|uniref:hypothetical protein n=1 Tax=Curtobacterium sp. P97 TaxID=2939562 RepID=UPI00203C03D1